MIDRSRGEFIFNAFIRPNPEPLRGWCDIMKFRSFDHLGLYVTRKTVLNMLEAIYLRLR